jgi:hypothetical protein
MFDSEGCALGYLLLPRSPPNRETALSEMGNDMHCPS